jgi:hypothetical protein
MLDVPEDADLITAGVLSAVEKNGKWTGDVRMSHKNRGVGWLEFLCAYL